MASRRRGPHGGKQKEIDNLKVAHKSALETLRDRAETEHEKIKSSFGTELDGAIKARDEAIQQHVALQGQVSEFENAITEQEVDNVEEYMVANASDIYENDEAFDDFILAWKSGAGIEGMKLMNMKPDTAAATQGGEPRSFEEMMLARKQEAQREADLIRNA